MSIPTLTITSFPNCEATSSKMYSKALIVITCVSTAWAVCPPVLDQAPCSCDEENLRFYCGSDTAYDGEWDIKAYFDRISSLIDTDVIFNEILITLSSLRTIPAGALQTIKFKRILFELNFELKYIHPDAFGETTNVTTHLSIFENRKLANYGDGHTERDLFDVISKFKAAESILIHYNNVSSIPDEGFGPLPNLKTFRLGSGLLSRIGSRAFSQLPNLQSAELGSSNISINGIADDAFEGVGSKAEICMEGNPLTRLSKIPFKSLLDNANGIAVGGRVCFWVCYDIELDCDEVSAWMCSDVEKYQPKIKGFVCRSGSGYGNIWDYCAAKGNNK